MKRFLYKVSLFILGFLLINFLFYYLVARPAIYLRYLHNSGSADTYNLFLLGDSHAATLKDYPSQCGIFNFAYESDNYLDMYLKTLYISSFAGKGDTILLSADKHTLTDYRKSSVNLSRNIVYADYNLNYLREKDRPENPDLRYSPFNRYFPLLNGHFASFYSEYLRPFKSVVPRDFSKLSKEVKEFNYRSRYESQFQDRNMSESQEYYLRKIISLCREKEIFLIGIEFPISQGYWKYIEDIPSRAANILKTEGVPVLDLHDQFDRQESVFHDQDHLNRKGAALFCGSLKAHIKNL